MSFHPEPKDFFMIAVRSSNLAAIGYNPMALILTIVFHGGRVYRYFAVPPGVFRALLAAPSAGRYFHAAIRNRYPCCRIA